MSSTRPSWGPPILRLMLAAGFLYHGIPKLFSAAGHASFVGFLTATGIPLPGVTSWAVGALEVFGALALLAGVLVTWATLLLAVEMIVAGLTVHLSHGFGFIQVTGMSAQGPVFGMPGVEVNLLYLAMLVSLALTGPGALSIGRPREA
jgi:putative oxidoreductase